MVTFTYGEWAAVYNALSFGIAGMGAACVFAFFQHFNISKNYRTALIINGLVTLIATYHYYRIFDSWNAAYTVGEVKGAYTVVATGKPFNDAYRYVDWLLTVPLLLLELVLVMGLPADETRSLAWKLGVSSAVMVAFGYPGEISSDTTTRWIFWAIAMIPFLFVVGTLVVGLAPKKGKKGDKGDADSQRLDTLLSAARYLTVFSWCTYPVIYCVKTFGVNSAQATAIEQVGYSLADFLAKAVFGVLIWAIASTKSELEEAAASNKPAAKDVEAASPAEVGVLLPAPAAPVQYTAAPIQYAQQPVTTSYMQASPVAAAYPTTAYATPYAAPLIMEGR